MRRPACPEIGHLPEIAHGVKSVNFRRTTPGSIYRIVHATRPPPPHSVLDPTHPALTYSPHDFTRAFPWRALPGFRFRAVPHGLLDHPLQPVPSPPYALNHGLIKDRRSVNMSLLDTAPKSVGGRVVRQNTLRRFKTAISLIVTRGADVDGPEDGEKKVVFRGADPPENWVLPNWTYIIRPELEAHSMPYSTLIPLLRDVLQLTAATGRRLEREWARLKEVTLQSRGAKTEFKRLFLPSQARPPPSQEDKAKQDTLVGALRKFSQPHAGAPKHDEASAEPPPTLLDLFKRHSKREPADFRTPAKAPDPAELSSRHRGTRSDRGGSSTDRAVKRGP
ncbi:hypothetical protein BV20DRAFT_1057592 [Pilatotrama ljubarskyi]|nr:hypothetical protein BV20DRAFT_1057592 [Pilatotrama ljubarskyi]